MKVLFSFHAKQRMQERLQINVSTTQEYDLTKLNFVKSHSYLNTSIANDSNTYIAFCFNDKSMPIVLAVDKNTRVVTTVYLGKKLAKLNAPFVDTCYAKIGVTL
jgi:hypothetical protein